MLYIAIIFFTLATLLGLYLLSFVLTNKETPKGIAFLHGPMAAIGLIILIIYALYNKPSPIVSIIIFILAAFGGIMLIYRDLSGQSIPKWMAIGHGLTAIIAFIFLLIFAFVK